MKNKSEVIGILFNSEDEDTVEQARAHLLEGHKELYWSIGNFISKDRYPFPDLIGLINVKSKGIKYRCLIADIVPYHSSHHENYRIKPESWRHYKKLKNYCMSMMFTKIDYYDCDWKELKKPDGKRVTSLRGYQPIILPENL